MSGRFKSEVANNLNTKQRPLLEKSFEDLAAWKFCRELRNTLTELAKNLPGEEKFRLADQLVNGYIRFLSKQKEVVV